MTRPREKQHHRFKKLDAFRRQYPLSPIYDSGLKLMRNDIVKCQTHMSDGERVTQPFILKVRVYIDQIVQPASHFHNQ